MNTQAISSLSLVELKQLAKGRRIKQYYIMKRAHLIQLLSMDSLPETFKIEKMTIHELRDAAKEKGIRGFWSLHREDLITLLFPNYEERQPGQGPTYQDEKDQRNANEHDKPEEHNAH